VSIFQKIGNIAKKVAFPTEVSAFSDSNVCDLTEIDTDLQDTASPDIEIPLISHSVYDTYAESLEYKNNGLYRKTIESLENIEKVSPGFKDIYNLLQETYTLYAVQNVIDLHYSSAIPLLKRAQALSKTDEEIATLLSHRAYCENQMGHHEFAKDTLAKALRISSVCVFECYGTRLVELGWLDVVKNAAIDLKDEAERCYLEGFKSNNNSEKLELYKRAITLCPDYVNAHYSLGCFYQKNLDTQNAIHSFKETYNLNPDYENVAKFLAYIFFNDSCYSDTIPFLEKAITICKFSDEKAVLCADLAYSKFQLFDKDGAINALVESFKIDPKVAYAKYADTFDFDHWSICIENSCQFEPSKHKSRDIFLAELHWKHGFRFSAPQYFYKALEYNPKYAQAHYSLGCYFKKNGQLQKALEHFRLTNDCQSEFENCIEYIESLEMLFNKKNIVELASVESISLDAPEDALVEQHSNYIPDLTKETKEFEKLQHEIHSLSRQVSEDHQRLRAYEEALQVVENGLRDIRHQNCLAVPSKDREIDILQMQLQQYQANIAELKSSFSREISALQQEVAELKQQVNRTDVQHITAPVDVSGLLSPQDIATIINSLLWEDFNSSLSPSKLFSNFLWEKAQAGIPLDRFGQIKVCDLSKQLKLTSIADTDLTIGHCLSLSYYDFINTSPDQILNPVFLCIAALMVLADSQKVEITSLRQEAEELPTVAAPSTSDNHHYTIPRPQYEATSAIQRPFISDRGHQEIPVVQTTSADSAHHFANSPSLINGNGLDLSKIQLMQHETEKVSQLLGNIFADEDNAEDSEESVQSAPPSDYSILDLDEIHSAFLYVLATKSIWKRDELEKVASGRRLLLAGVLNTINESVCEVYGEPLFDGDDPIELNMEVVQQITAKSGR
jgi:tetratricopeptide (TPR) repeat protein